MKRLANMHAGELGVDFLRHNLARICKHQISTNTSFINYQCSASSFHQQFVGISATDAFLAPRRAFYRLEV